MQLQQQIIPAMAVLYFERDIVTGGRWRCQPWVSRKSRWLQLGKFLSSNRCHYLSKYMFTRQRRVLIPNKPSEKHDESSTNIATYAEDAAYYRYIGEVESGHSNLEYAGERR